MTIEEASTVFRSFLGGVVIFIFICITHFVFVFSVLCLFVPLAQPCFFLHLYSILYSVLCFLCSVFHNLCSVFSILYFFFLYFVICFFISFLDSVLYNLCSVFCFLCAVFCTLNFYSLFCVLCSKGRCQKHPQGGVPRF